jgi:hypothetical protein
MTALAVNITAYVERVSSIKTQRPKIFTVISFYISKPGQYCACLSLSFNCLIEELLSFTTFRSAETEDAKKN